MIFVEVMAKKNQYSKMLSKLAFLQYQLCFFHDFQEFHYKFLQAHRTFIKGYRKKIGIFKIFLILLFTRNI
jgi:hypothetical protein